jgi:hypothetical protein
MRSLRWLSLLGMVISLGTFAVAAPARAASTDPASCPLKPSSATPPGEAWAFTDTGPPSSAHPGVSSSYTHGRGTWGAGRGSGTICVEDGTSAGASHNLVLAVAGQARISPQITRLGHPGVGLVLKVSVNASDDQACTAGTHGTVTLFASYYQGHHDSVQFHFAAPCGAYDYTYSGSAVHALIADDGHQVS